MLTLTGVEKSLEGGNGTVRILQEIDLTVPDGQFVAIMGPSGSGKSTLLGLIAGLDSVTAGAIELDGRAITKMGEDELALLRRHKIGFVFQTFQLLPNLTALENVALPLELAGDAGALEKAEAMLRAVDLLQRARHYPVQLSGGEQQRVAVARAFVHNPLLLLADEPTGNLDSVNGNAVLDLMVKLNRERGTTVVMVTHDREVAGRADRIIRLKDGRVASDEKVNGIDLKAGERV
jgi:putative ABC transport system ATP-binding protein